MRFRILGPLEVVNSGHDLTPSAPKQRAVLALLILRRNRTVQITSLIDELWDDRPPESALPTLQTYIYKLRKLLNGAQTGVSRAMLRTTGYGYQLDVLPKHSDLDLFEEYAEDGARALEAGAPARARQSLAEALKLWRGPALANVPTGARLGAEVTQLEERRLRTLELRMDADLQLGRHHGLVSELKAAVIAHPMHETFYAKLMTALALSGRPHEALDSYRRLQRTLRDELALDPSPELRALQQAILKSEPLPVPRARVNGGGNTTAPAPALLPPDPSDFAGRTALLSDLERWLTEPDAASGPGRAVSLIGAPGIGKTALAVHAAHRVRGRFPDGQLFAELRGTSTTPAEPHEILVELLRAVGDLPPAGSTDLDLSAASRRFRGWCAERKVLIVLDDAASDWQVEPLLPTAPGCAVIVTSRLAHWLPQARVLRVPPLRAEEGLRMLVNGVGRRRIDAEFAAATEIVRLTGGLPLAIRGVVARLTTAPDWALSRFASHLTTASSLLAELSLGSIDLRARYDSTYRKLENRERWAFRLLALIGDREFSSRDVESLLGVPPRTVEGVLARLVEFQLLTMADGGTPSAPRYSFCGLARHYAAERLANAVGQVPGEDTASVAGVR